MKKKNEIYSQMSNFLERMIFSGWNCFMMKISMHTNTLLHASQYFLRDDQRTDLFLQLKIAHCSFETRKNFTLWKYVNIYSLQTVRETNLHVTENNLRHLHSHYLKLLTWSISYFETTSSDKRAKKTRKNKQLNDIIQQWVNVCVQQSWIKSKEKNQFSRIIR